jgi:heme A synthase
MKKNIILCWAHVILFAITFFALSIVWPKWLHTLAIEGTEPHNVDLYNRIFPVFSWLQHNLIAVLLFLAAFTIDLFICLGMKSNKQKLIWTIVLFVAFVIAAVAASFTFRTALFG